MATPTELSKELDHGLQFIFYQRINTYYELYILQVPRNIYYNSKLHAYLKLKKIKFKIQKKRREKQATTTELDHGLRFIIFSTRYKYILYTLRLL